jgi:ankyrin repeat protein
MSQLKEFTTAVNIGDIERINELLPEIQNSNLIDSCDPEGEPVLYYAARNGYLAVMRIFLSAGANPSVKDK